MCNTLPDMDDFFAPVKKNYLKQAKPSTHRARIFRTFIKALKMLLSLSKILFDKLKAPGVVHRGLCLLENWVRQRACPYSEE